MSTSSRGRTAATSSCGTKKRRRLCSTSMGTRVEWWVVQKSWLNKEKLSHFIFKVHLSWPKVIFFWLSLLNVNIKLDSRFSHLESRLLSLKCHSKRFLSATPLSDQLSSIAKLWCHIVLVSLLSSILSQTNTRVIRNLKNIFDGCFLLLQNMFYFGRKINVYHVYFGWSMKGSVCLYEFIKMK